MKGITFLIASIALSATSFCFAQDIPTKGVSKKHVAAHYGQPVKKHASIGKPPISRWVYPDFEVVFEYNHVVHAYQRLNEIDSLDPSEYAPRSALRTQK